METEKKKRKKERVPRHRERCGSDEPKRKQGGDSGHKSPTK